MQVWQAILVRQVDLDSPQAKQQLSEGARDLLSVSFDLAQFGSLAAMPRAHHLEMICSTVLHSL